MAKDRIHEAVKTALEKAGWVVTHQPFTVKTGKVIINMDLASERPVFAESNGRKIIVEIKSMDHRSMIYDFHSALGQYLNYRGGLKDEGIDREIYLATSEGIFRKMNRTPFYGKRIAEFGLKIFGVVGLFN